MTRDQLAQFAAWRTRFADVARDAAALVGGGLIAYGAGMIYAPAGFIVGGAMLIAVAFLSALKAKA
jgi:hypothetical protein